MRFGFVRSDRFHEGDPSSIRRPLDLQEAPIHARLDHTLRILSIAPHYPDLRFRAATNECDLSPVRRHRGATGIISQLARGLAKDGDVPDAGGGT